MAQIDTANTFVDGDVVNAAALNNIIDEAEVLAGIISEQDEVTSTLATDEVVLVRGGALKRVNVSELPSGVTSVAWATGNPTPDPIFNGSVDTQSTTPRIHFSLANQNTRRQFLASPVASGGVPSFRSIAPQDTAATVTVTGLSINWSLGNVFSKSVTASTNLAFTNPTEGQQITLHIGVGENGTFGVTFPVGANGVYWAGDTVYNKTDGQGAHDILIFRYIAGHYYGNYLLNFRAIT